MFIGITGTFYSGQETIVEWFTSNLGYKELRLNEYYNEPENLLKHVIEKWRGNSLISYCWPWMAHWKADTIGGAQSKDLNHLLTFMTENDKSWNKIYETMTMADIPIMYSPTKDNFYKQLKLFNTNIPEILRPQKEMYFMMLSEMVAIKSNCMSRKVGCVLTKNDIVISTGYNGTPKGTKNCNEGNCVYCNNPHVSGEGLENCLCIHAEDIALSKVGTEAKDCILYCNT
ncbi:7025_t:CDS:2 [Scutellospora calospora]|uniref:7025_t:CDS:1 n=1 Tax=Scutellospora calospora TaxID=85575 RepID=A0ACA9JUA6_9GLOM|nr:7025_t:CDS:2 [Scutellospora calospora]